MSTQLPYVFDLLYDLKTLEQLNDHLSGKQRSATMATDAELYELARVNMVNCDFSGEKQSTETKMVTLLKHLTRPECGVMQDLVTKIKDLLKECGHADSQHD